LLIDAERIGKREGKSNIVIEESLPDEPEPWASKSSPGKSPLLAPQIYVQPRKRKIRSKMGTGMPKSHQQDVSCCSILVAAFGKFHFCFRFSVITPSSENVGEVRVCPANKGEIRRD
jgi:hypothetical protein